MSQSKLESSMETCVSTTIGFLVSYVAWPLAGWWFDVPVSTAQQFNIVAFFTVISLIRGYVIRRFFNGYVKQLVHWLSLRTQTLISGIF
jgi:predicted Na+-dependent transporter